MHRSRLPATCAVALFSTVICPFSARGAPDACPSEADVPTLVRCALERNALLRRARSELEAARGRRTTAALPLPANPTIDVLGGYRRGEGGRAETDRGIDLTQAVAIGGQRGARLEVASAEIEAAEAAVAGMEREVAADVLLAATDVVRARALVRFAETESALAGRLVEAASARTRQGLGAALDVDLAEAARVQATRAERAARLDLGGAERRLAAVVGTVTALAPDAPMPPGYEPRGDVSALEAQALRQRGVVAVARAETRASVARVALLHREVTPDLTLTASVRHDDFADVVGGRLGVALPLFRRNQGAIEEGLALTRKAEAAVDQVELEVRLEVRATLAAWQRASDLAATVPKDLDERLSADVEALRDAHARGTLPFASALVALREAFAARRGLVEVRTDVLRTSFELARVVGAPAVSAAGVRP